MDYLIEHSLTPEDFYHEYGHSRYDYSGNVYEVGGLSSDSVYLVNVNDDTAVFIPLSCWKDFVAKNVIE